MVDISVRSLLEAGVHFGHQTRRWNPKMAPYIFGAKDKVHIIDLDRTAVLLQNALNVAHDIAANGGRILFVGTKRQSCSRVAESAAKCGQYYVNHRWLGGMLTNWKTVSLSIKKLEELEKRLQDENVVLKKKEILNLQRKTEKLNKALGGVRNMGGIPSLLFVLDVIVNKTAVEEAKVLGIPVIGICDTNADPTEIDFPVPGNDDSVKSIDLYCSLMEESIISGVQKGLSMVGVDIGDLKNPESTEFDSAVESEVIEPEADIAIDDNGSEESR
jgi:small subunit ribosomal protein S2